MKTFWMATDYRRQGKVYTRIAGSASPGSLDHVGLPASTVPGRDACVPAVAIAFLNCDRTDITRGMLLP